MGLYNFRTAKRTQKRMFRTYHEAAQYAKQAGGVPQRLPNGTYVVVYERDLF